MKTLSLAACLAVFILAGCNAENGQLNNLMVCKPAMSQEYSNCMDMAGKLIEKCADKMISLPNYNEIKNVRLAQKEGYCLFERWSEPNPETDYSTIPYITKPDGNRVTKCRVPISAWEEKGANIMLLTNNMEFESIGFGQYCDEEMMAG